MSTTPIKGENGILFLYLDDAWKPIACLTSNSLSTTVEVIERQTKCAPGVTEKSAGVFNYTLSAEGEYIDTTSVGGDDEKASHDKLLALQTTRELQTWKLDTDMSNANSVKYYGTALITDLSLDQAVNENSTFSATLDGNGAILTTDPTLTIPVFINSFGQTINLEEGETFNLNTLLASNSGEVTSWSFSGTLPTGTSLNTSTGVISYTTELSEYEEVSGTITATNADGSATKGLTIQFVVSTPSV
jgi:TP901-1 family phage major tail protein